MERVWIKPLGCRVYHLFTRNAALCGFCRRLAGLPERPVIKESEACKVCWKRR